MNLYIKPLLAFMCVLSFLVGCGFHLRGSPTLTSQYHSIAIINSTHNQRLEKYLKSYLLDNELTINNNIKQADIILSIDSENMQQQVISISASANARQYELKYIVHYHYLTGANKPFEAQKIVIQRNITFNSNRMLGSDYENTQIIQEMYQEAATRIIIQLNQI